MAYPASYLSLKIVNFVASEKLADRVPRMQMEFDRASEESGEDAQAELF